MLSHYAGSPFLITTVILSTIGAGFDLKSRKIPNQLTFSGFIIGVVLHTALDGVNGLLSSLAGAVLCGGIFIIFYLAGGTGAGDVKLMTAAAAIAGLPHIAFLLVFTALAGGVMAIILAIMHGRVSETIRNVGSIAVHHARNGLTPHHELNVGNKSTLRLPYGVAIALGSLLTLYMDKA